MKKERRTRNISLIWKKRNAEQSSLKKLRINDKVSTGLKEISEAVTNFYKQLYSKDEGIEDAGSLLNSIKTHSTIIDEDSKKVCDGDITLDEIKKSIAKLKNNKAPGNGGLTSEFFNFGCLENAAHNVPKFNNPNSKIWLRSN